MVKFWTREWARLKVYLHPPGREWAGAIAGESAGNSLASWLVCRKQKLSLSLFLARYALEASRRVFTIAVAVELHRCSDGRDGRDTYACTNWESSWSPLSAVSTPISACEHLVFSIFSRSTRLIHFCTVSSQKIQQMCSFFEGSNRESARNV